MIEDVKFLSYNERIKIKYKSLQTKPYIGIVTGYTDEHLMLKVKGKQMIFNIKDILQIWRLDK